MSVSDAMEFVESIIPRPREEYEELEIRCAVMLVDSMQPPEKPDGPEEVETF